MPVDKYKAFYEIVKMLMRMDLTKLRAIQKELSVLSKVTKSVQRKTKNGSRSMNKTKRKSSKKKPSPAQLRARKQFAMRVKRGDFR